MSHQPPIVFEEDQKGEKGYDIYSRMLKDRVIFLKGVIDEDLANSVVAQLLFLESQDSSKTIDIYINSPGGSVTDGLAIYDTMKSIKCPIRTVVVGRAASMAAILLASGDRRVALPNAEVMIHQPSCGMQGVVTDLNISLQRLNRMKDKLTNILARHTNRDIMDTHADMERDYWMTAQEARDYGIVDKIKESKK